LHHKWGGNNVTEMLLERGARYCKNDNVTRALQEIMGHRDFKTTLIYADRAPNAREAEWVEAAFRTSSDTLEACAPIGADA
jgi:integrase